MTLHRSAPRPITGTLSSLRDGWAPQTLLADVQRAWHDAVGESIAAEATPVSEGGGVVTIGCSSAAWAQELDLMSSAVIERLNQDLTAGRVRRLKCVSGR